LLTDCQKLTEKRNELIHGLWAKELNGDAKIRDEYGSVRPLPKVKELTKLAKEMKNFTEVLNFERLEGFLKNALSKLKK